MPVTRRLGQALGRGLIGLLGAALLLGTPAPVQAQAETYAQPRDFPAPWTRPSLNHYGVPGLFDMPSAWATPDAELSATMTVREISGALTLRFQFSERLAGAFRYSLIDDLFGRGDYFDRSFDVSYQILREDRMRPALTLGLQDLGGTGIFAGEYLVAGKTFGKLRTTLGVGWGRFGSYNGFEHPIGSLSNRGGGGGLDGTGQPDFTNWFRGDMAFFGGLEYQLTDRVRLAVEYSSDDYELEQNNIDFPRNSPINIGADLNFGPKGNLRFSYLYGSTLALQYSYGFDPKNPNSVPRGSGAGPVAIAVRPEGSAADLGWVNLPNATENVRDAVVEALDEDDIKVDRLTLGATRVEVQIRNNTMRPAQTIGRTARVLARVLPFSVETFEIVPMTGAGIPASRVIIQRSDVEALITAPDGAWQSFARARISDSVNSFGFDDVAVDIIDSVPGNRDPFRFRFGLYAESSYFDPSSPVRIDVGLRARATWEPFVGTIIATDLRQRLAGNRADLIRTFSRVQRVRSDAALYAEEGETAMRQLTIAQYFRPGTDLYGRVTAGYLERMYAGVSGEVLWKPVDSRLALGAELNYAHQRDFDQGFGLQDYNTITGHVSAYYKTRGDYHYQLDLGRYLAEDWGGTLGIAREFNNGVSVGVFATLTDMPFDDFGEGSFDKGFRVAVPFSVLTGAPSSRGISRTIRPVLRDGGARLDAPGRLYGAVRRWHEPGLQGQWGRVWH